MLDGYRGERQQRERLDALARGEGFAERSKTSEPFSHLASRGLPPVTKESVERLSSVPELSEDELKAFEIWKAGQKQVHSGLLNVIQEIKQEVIEETVPQPDSDVNIDRNLEQ